MRRPIIMFITALALILALSGCGDDDTEAATPAAGDEPTGEAACIGENEELLPDYVGLSEAQAVERAEGEGHSVRVVGEDGECLNITMDLREDRVNLELADGWVIAAAIF